MNEFGTLRGGPGEQPIRALAPTDHIGLTLSGSPRLWWSLSEATDRAIEITLVDERLIEPVFEAVLPGPHDVGLYSIELAQSGVCLDSGGGYRWFVTLLVEPGRPTRNPVSMGALRVVAEGDSRRTAVLAASPAQRGHTLAAEGIWYDAFDFFAELARNLRFSGPSRFSSLHRGG